MPTLRCATKGNHLLVKPGDRVPIKGLCVEILTADGNVLPNRCPGAGQPNPYCASHQPKDEDKTENSHSTGSLIAYGKFRFLDLGDLTWDKEMALVCPDNRIGTVDVYLTTHHGLSQSGSPALVDAVHPRVAIMNNGATKGGNPDAWQMVHDVPGLEGLWQIHTAESKGAHNTDPQMIANLDSKSDEGNLIKLTRASDRRVYGDQRAERIQQDLPGAGAMKKARERFGVRRARRRANLGGLTRKREGDKAAWSGWTTVVSNK